MRFPLRPFTSSHRHTVSFALVAALIAGIGLVTIPQAAQAQPPVTGVRAAAPAVVTPAVAPAVAPAARPQRASIARIEYRAAASRATSAAAQVQQTRTRIVQVARKQVGDRYSAGSSGPNAFDCSGLTRYVYKTVTGKELPHQSRAQYAKVKRIPRSKAKPGDLVFFFRGGAHHVGIYIGNGKMVDAAGYGKGVRISPISGSWWSRTYSGMGRLLPA